MARPKDPRRLEKIQDIALKNFAERGYHGASIKEIANEAGISLGSLYTYYPSKEELVNDLFIMWKLRLRDEAGQKCLGLCPRESHREFWRGVGRFIIANPVAFTFLDAQTHAPYLNKNSLAFELELTRGAIEFYRHQLNLKGSDSNITLLISASFGAISQVVKASKAGLLSFDDATIHSLEEQLWLLTSKLN